MLTTGSQERLSPLGFGCARIGSFNNPMSTAATMKLLEHALDRGVTLLDTADIYGQGDSERAVGRLLRRRRGAAFVVTKVGRSFSLAMRAVRPLKPLLKPLLNRSAIARSRVTGNRSANMATDFSPGAVTRALDASLRRLRFSTVDALLLHSPMAADIQEGAVGEALERARRAGKIRHYGVACDDVDVLTAALALPGVDFIEIPPPLLDEAAGAIAEAVAARGLRVLLREVLRYRGDASPSQAVCNALQRPEIASVIVGTTSSAHLDELLGAVAGRKI